MVRAGGPAVRVGVEADQHVRQAHGAEERRQDQRVGREQRVLAGQPGQRRRPARAAPRGARRRPGAAPRRPGSPRRLPAVSRVPAGLPAAAAVPSTVDRRPARRRPPRRPCRTSTEVAAGKVGGASAVSAPRPSSRPCQITSSTIAGTAIAVSFTQYWKAWTKVMLRIPPTATLSGDHHADHHRADPGRRAGDRVAGSARRPATAAPGRASRSAPRSRWPAPRSAPECSRASAKSGSVYAPERRSGAATYSSIAR